MENLPLVATMVLGLTQAVKIAGLNSRFIPLSAVLLGVILSYMVADTSVIGGIVAGLTACGLYSGVKSTVGV
jgi:hypothetical protein